MKALILGGTGFVGSHVARAYAKAGWEVTLAARGGSPRDLVADVEASFVAADVTDVRSLEAAFAGHQVVVHCAGVLSLWGRESEQLYRVNVLGTRNVVRACRAAGVERLIYNGSVGVYAGQRSPTPVDEDGAPNTERYHSFHVVSMGLAEAEALRGAAQGLETVLLHPTLVVGEGDRNFHSSWALVGLAALGVSVVPPGGLNLVDVLDVARANLHAATRGRSGHAYLIGGENLTNAAYAELLQEVLGRRGLALKLPRGPFKALGSTLERFSRLTGRDRGTYVTLNEALSSAMSLYWFVDDSKARRELGHGPGPVEAALARQVEWLRAQGALPEGLDLPGFARRFLWGA